MPHRVIKALFFLALIVLTALLFADLGQINQVSGNDKIAHGSAFFVLTWLFILGWRLPVLPGFLLLALYAGSTEIGQLFLPYRSGSLADWAADLLGIGLAYGCYLLIQKWYLTQHD